MVNKVILLGRLGADPEVRRLESGAVVAKIRMATSERYKDKNSGEWQEQTEWHNVIMWRFLAERAEQQLKKGNLIYVEGKLTHRKYDDKDGNTRYISEVVAAVFRNLTPRDNTGDGYFTGLDQSAPAAATDTAKESVTEATDAPDDDLPF